MAIVANMAKNMTNKAFIMATTCHEHHILPSLCMLYVLSVLGIYVFDNIILSEIS